jgi:hypothetical protein
MINATLFLLKSPQTSFLLYFNYNLLFTKKKLQFTTLPVVKNVVKFVR